MITRLFAKDPWEMLQDQKRNAQGSEQPRKPAKREYALTPAKKQSLKACYGMAFDIPLTIGDADDLRGRA